MMKESLDFRGYMGHSVQNETCGSRKISLNLVIKRPDQVMENELHQIVGIKNFLALVLAFIQNSDAHINKK